MSAKKYLYAAVGVQVAAAKTAQAKIEQLKSKMTENATSASSDLQSRIDTWAGEGEQFLGKVGETKAIDELTSKVDFDQVQNQVHKLRDQLDDIVATWRSNFRPESRPAVKVTVEATPTVPAGATATAAKTTATKTTARKPAAKTTAAKTTAAKTTAAKTAATKTTATKTTAAKTTARKPAAKTTATKTTAAKSTAAKKPATKSTATKKPAAKTTAQKAS